MNVAAVYVVAFLLTVVTEHAVLWVLTRRDAAHVLLASLAINLATFPVANYAFRSVTGWRGAGTALAVAVVETGIVLAETPLIRWLLRPTWARSLGASVAANGSSMALSVFFW